MLRSVFVSTWLVPALCLAFASVATASAATAQALPDGALPAPSPTTALDRDNTKGNWLNFEVGPVTAVATDPLEIYVFVLNQPGMRVTAFYRPTMTKVLDVPVGPGVVSMTGRPSTLEIWVADAITNSITVIDLVEQSIVRTIPVGAAPQTVLFSASGDRAFVSCAGSDTVDVISTSSMSVVDSIAVPSKSPRGLAWADGRAWVAPLLSGNNTTPLEEQLQDYANGNYDPSVGRVLDLNTLTLLEQIPDFDLTPITLGSGAATNTIPTSGYDYPRGAGTVLLNLRTRALSGGGEQLWIVGTDARNAEFLGEQAFPGGAVVRNQVAILNPVGAGALTPFTIVDLDAIAPSGVGCAQPSDVVFDASANRAYVSCYGSDTIVKLNTSTNPPSWAGYCRVEGAGGAGAGPRSLALGAVTHTLYVLNKGDNSLATIDLSTAAMSGETVSPLMPLGYDPTPADVKRGRFHIISAKNSLSGTSSCASCHVDGHTDMIGWELGKFMDPESTATANVQFEIDDKGVMVTQSLRGLREAGPLHWRGEQESLADFNGAFEHLLERTVGGNIEPLPSADFEDLEAYVFSLVYPANPREESDRALTTAQAAGKTLFGSDCAACHALPLGTNTELQSEIVGLKSSSSKVAQLRGVQDKLVQGYPELAMPHLGNKLVTDTPEAAARNLTGYGLLHNGNIASLKDFVSRNVFTLTGTEEDQVVAFLKALDSGLAPSTAVQFTYDAESPTATSDAVAAEARLDDLLAQAAAGHCDIVFSATWEESSTVVQSSGAYDHRSGDFQLQSAAYSQLDPALLIGWATYASGKVTVFGLPLGMGWRSGVDRDLDELLDWDEYGAGTDPEDGDSDDDGYPDGHELAHSGDPLNALVHGTDTTSPYLRNGPTVIYKTQTTAKIDFTTSKPCHARVRRHDVPGLYTNEPEGPFDVNHSLIVTGLVANHANAVEVEITDAAGHVVVATTTLSVVTQARVDPPASRVELIDVSSVATTTDSSGVHRTAYVEITVADGAGAPIPSSADMRAQAFAYVQHADGTLEHASLAELVLIDAGTGVGDWKLELPLDTNAHGGMEWLHVGVRFLGNFAGSQNYQHVEALDVQNFASFKL